MKNAIICGPSGMIGGLVLQECLKNSDIEKVTAFIRKPLEINHPKLTKVMVEDFMDYSAHEAHFQNIDICFYCIGVYTGTVSRDDFRKITTDYTMAFADTFKKHNPDGAFIFLSGQGADRNEKSRLMFAKDKGAAENYLISQEFKSLHIFRPGYIYPVTKRVEPTFAYKLMRAIYPVFKTVYSSGVITSEELARAMFNTGLYGGDKQIYENSDIKKIQL